MMHCSAILFLASFFFRGLSFSHPCFLICVCVVVFSKVDYATDALIQRTIRSEFAGCTTFVIAHRLSTVMDCDRILVMDKGQLVEEGSPSALLASETSFFKRMFNVESRGGVSSDDDLLQKRSGGGGWP